MDGVSEWNEQQLFAQLFFSITDQCRFAQANHKILDWKRFLDTKISLVMGISNDKERENIDEQRKKINKKAMELLGRNINRNRLGLFYDVLFYAEVEVDKIAHKHMPFLKLKKKVSIRGL
jgi:hypothetical protein